MLVSVTEHNPINPAFEASAYANPDVVRVVMKVEVDSEHVRYVVEDLYPQEPSWEDAIDYIESYAIIKYNAIAYKAYYQEHVIGFNQFKASEVYAERNDKISFRKEKKRYEV